MKLLSITLLLTLALASSADAACRDGSGLDPNLCSAPRPHVTMKTSPQSPHVASPVTFTASSLGRRVTYAWDFDADGQFDDASGRSATATLPAGRPSVGVRATDEFGRSATETRTIGVHAWNATPVPTLTLGAASPRAGHPFDVTAEASDVDGTIAQIELDLDDDGAYEVTVAGAGPLKRSAEFAATGVHTLRARVTDDGGSAAVATAQVDVGAGALPPTVTIFARGQVGYRDSPFFVGETATVQGLASDPDGAITRYEFDLDGDGTYETDRGSNSSVTLPLTTAGDREVGVRVTDADGDTATSRRSLSVIVWGDPAWTVWPVFESHATTGVPADLGFGVYGSFAPVSLEWDLDGDGQYDDSTSNLASADMPRESHTSHTFSASGTYTVGVRVTANGRVRTSMQTVTVRDPATAGIATLAMPKYLRPGVKDLFRTTTPPGMVLSYDLDGDGQFDETPATTGSLAEIALTAPTTVAVKATAGASSVVSTVEMTPLAGNLGAYAELEAIPEFSPTEPVGPFVAGGQTFVSRFFGDVDRTCCQGTPTTTLSSGFLLNHRTTPIPGPLTITARGSDQGEDVSVQQAFTVSSWPPSVAFTMSGSTATAMSSYRADQIASWAWDLDADGAFDDATGPTATVGSLADPVGLMAVASNGERGIYYAKPNTVGATPQDTPPDEPPAPAPEQPAAPGAPPPVPVPAALQLRVGAPKLSSKAVSVTASCSAACRTTVVVKLGKRVLGKATSTRGTVQVKLSAKARKLLRTTRERKLTITVSTPGAKTVTKTLKLKR